MQRGEIWLVNRRPVLIVSPEAFNRVMKVPVVLPITSGGSFARAVGFAVSLAGAGTKTIGMADASFRIGVSMKTASLGYRTICFAKPKPVPDATRHPIEAGRCA